jgi:SAM-dependent methyltransferase
MDRIAIARNLKETKMSDSGGIWNLRADDYSRLLKTSTNDLHFGVGIPGNAKLNLIPQPASEAYALDLGCGSGENLIALSALGYHVVGIDGSDRQVQLAAAQLASASIDGTVHKLSYQEAIVNLPKRYSEYFDLILSVGALHFSSQLSDVITMASLLCKAGGTLIISMPHPVDMITDYEVLAGKVMIKFNSYFPEGAQIEGARYWRKFGGKHRVEEDFKEYVYTMSSLISAVIDAGFDIARVLEPPCDHLPEYPCLFADPDPIFLTEFCARVPQYLMVVARRQKIMRGGNDQI